MAHDLTPYLEAIESEIRENLAAPEPSLAGLYQMMQYHLGWLDQSLQLVDAPQGKRLRPLFCLLACEAVGGDWRRALPAAAALELIHNFSLIHDDIEDHSDIRRHRPTVWAMWGIPQGINTGDAMWAISRACLSRLGILGHSAAAILAASQRLDQACLRLCQGQYLDLAFEQRDSVSLSEYEEMISGKTAALLSAAFAAGATLGGAAAEQVAAYAAFGHELGITFQIVDDILGVWGDPSVTGKSAASDILERKKALPLLYALQWERERGHTDLSAILARDELAAQDVPDVLALLERAGARDYAQAQAKLHQRQMLSYLDGLAAGPALAVISDLAQSLLSRRA